jgi:hypothetical protein
MTRSAAWPFALCIKTTFYGPRIQGSNIVRVVYEADRHVVIFPFKKLFVVDTISKLTTWLMAGLLSLHAPWSATSEPPDRRQTRSHLILSGPASDSAASPRTSAAPARGRCLAGTEPSFRPPLARNGRHCRRTASAAAPPRAPHHLGVDVKVILTPPCFFI